MELTYKDCDDGSAKNTSTERVVCYILVLSQLRRKFPLSSLGSVIYPLSFAFQLTISFEFFLLQPFFVTLNLSSSQIFAHLLEVLSSFPGTHPMYFSFLYF